ncbi:MAG: tetratricopeptide repeat protein [Moorea sp. SIO2B7]|nr:tetratricopeptide repeat protein [Moorena sp. SIO2B7]
MEKYQEAISAYDQAIQINETFWEAWLLKGILLSQIGNFNPASNSFKKVIKAKTNSTAQLSALNGIGFVLQQLKRDKEALYIYNKALKIKPNDQASLINREQLMRKLVQSKVFPIGLNFRRPILLGSIS